MRDVIVLAVILALFIENLWRTIGWWQEYRDHRAARGVIAAVGLLLGAMALAVATWAVHGEEQVRLLEVVVILVNFGQGVLLTVGVALTYFALTDRRRTP